MSDVVKSLRGKGKQCGIPCHGKAGLKIQKRDPGGANEKARVKEAWLHKDSEHKGISPAAGYQVKKTLWWEQFCVTILEAQQHIDLLEELLLYKFQLPKKIKDKTLLPDIG